MAVEISLAACPSVIEEDEYCDMIAIRLWVWAPFRVLP